VTDTKVYCVVSFDLPVDVQLYYGSEDKMPARFSYSLSAVEGRFTKSLKILCLEVVLESSVVFFLVYQNEYKGVRF